MQVSEKFKYRKDKRLNKHDRKSEKSFRLQRKQRHNECYEMNSIN